MSNGARKSHGESVALNEQRNLVTGALRQIARVPGFLDTKSGIRSYQSHVKQDHWLPVLFALCFVLPTLAGAVYYGLIASDRYVTETQFVIRPTIGTADKAAPDSVGTNAGIPKEMLAQDTLVTLEYLRSRPMVEALQAQLPLREWYGRDDIDMFSRFDPEKSIEKFLRYWKRRVSIDVEQTTGVLTLSVEAFDPDESLAVTKAVMKEAERMVNDLSRAARQDALVESDRELKIAGERLAKINLALTEARNRDGVLDAKKANEANLKVLDELRSQRINLSIQLAVGQRDLGSQSRQIIDLKQKIRDLNDNIALIEQQTATANPEQKRRLSDALTRFEDLSQKRREAETYLEEVRKATERARILSTQQVAFFSPITEPARAESSTEPRRVLMISLIAAGSAVLFAATMFARKVLFD
ncbi:capsule biosynthesis protein [Methylobacterium sp. J-030]|uniref:capsule biosynthesis protein n=1 Tax=Methylobacterium sp. J-030 TaxID=2836627 RepID=UPI001FBBD2FA|nr:capsule biosynthesis protein [Methylobacterium sp. J-030]MCJ2073131.1 capsule biosynthesis protein [Methylobacterium sp. J-030]